MPRLFEHSITVRSIHGKIEETEETEETSEARSQFDTGSDYLSSDVDDCLE